MIKAELKELYSIEVDDLASFTPEDDACFAIGLRMMVGPAGSEGAESFDVQVCTAEWLKLHYKDDPVVMLRHKLLVSRFDHSAIRRFIERFINGCSGETWQVVAEKVARLGRWEFEDYLPKEKRESR